MRPQHLHSSDCSVIVAAARVAAGPGRLGFDPRLFLGAPVADLPEQLRSSDRTMTGHVAEQRPLIAIVLNGQQFDFL